MSNGHKRYELIYPLYTLIRTRTLTSIYLPFNTLIFIIPWLNDKEQELRLYNFDAPFAIFFTRNKTVLIQQQLIIIILPYHEYNPNDIALYNFDLYPPWTDGVNFSIPFLPTDWLSTTSILQKNDW